MAESFLYGLDNSNKDFTTEEAFGKNVFTTAFPVALAMFMSEELELGINYIAAIYDSAPAIEHRLEPLEAIWGCPPSEAAFFFETPFEGYKNFATKEANRSDLVVKNVSTGEEVSAFEVKLVVVPTSGTAKKPRAEQCCELVVRPPSIEQLCFSAAASFGSKETGTIRHIIVDALGNPNDYEWANESFMQARRGSILKAANELIRAGHSFQRPFALVGEWRTQGQQPVLDDECFDAFVFSDFAFLQLFTNAMGRELSGPSNAPIGRPARALIWFVKSMYDYSTQGKVTFGKTHSLITFGGQTDKAGSFTNEGIRPAICCPNFIHPRVKSSDTDLIISPQGVALLKPERRLDAVLIHRGMEQLLNLLRSPGEAGALADE